jgi:Tol biopolymer transport system component/DNA-binding winged helix-turn-helix (wHTH) protein
MLTRLGNMGNNRVRVLLSDAVPPLNESAQQVIRRFGVFELDLRAGELRRHGHKIKLQEQPFQVLSLLLEKPGEVITREELRNRLWPADTFVDFDHSLNAAIRRLRDALGDSADNPTFVETVARRGYRFLAPVSLGAVNGNGIQAAVAAPVPLPGSRRSQRWWILASLSVLILVGLSIAIAVFFMPHPAAPPRISRLTANPADDPVRAAAISHDGRYLAFSDETGFFLRQIETGETHSLSLPKGLTATSISWFPDSVHMIVALSGEHRDSTSLWQISSLGGQPRKLLDDASLPAVSPNGQLLAFIAGRALHQRISLAAIDGTEPRQLVGEDGDLFGGVVWSPNGQQLAYTTAKFAYGHGVKAVINVIDIRVSTAGSTVRPTTVLSRDGLQGPMGWAPDGRLIYSVAEARPRQMDSNLFCSRIDRQNRLEGPTVRLTNDQGSVFSVSVSGDSKRIIYTKGIPEPDVYIATLDDSGALNEPQRLTLDDREDLPFDWTPDGKQVIFISDRTGIFSIYKQGLGQVVADMLVGGSQPLAEPRLSPDGTQLLYVVYPNGEDPKYEVPLMRVPLAGGPPHEVARANWISNHQCARAPATVCVYSVAGDKQVTFYTFDPFKGTGAKVFELKDELSQLYNWALSPDGSMLALARGKFGEEERDQIRIVFLNGAPEKRIILNGSVNLASVDWAADSKSLWAPTTDEKENELLRIDLHGNARSVWHPKKIKVAWAIPSRDGKKLALHVNSTSANIWMLERQ